MEYGSPNGKDDDEYTGDGLEMISKAFMMQNAFFIGPVSLDYSKNQPSMGDPHNLPYLYLQAKKPLVVG